MHCGELTLPHFFGTPNSGKNTTHRHLTKAEVRELRDLVGLDRVF